MLDPTCDDSPVCDVNLGSESSLSGTLASTSSMVIPNKTLDPCNDVLVITASEIHINCNLDVENKSGAEQ